MDTKTKVIYLDMFNLRRKKSREYKYKIRWKVSFIDHRGVIRKGVIIERGQKYTVRSFDGDGEIYEIKLYMVSEKNIIGRYGHKN